MSPLVQVRGLRVRRLGSLVLQVESLDIQTGEVLAVVGPNGSGKSTFLLALAQLLGRQDGEILFSGQPLREWNKLKYRRKISLVFQQPMLLDMTVADNVAVGLKFRGLPPARVREHVHTWLRRLGIESLARRRARELSGGEAQRVSLARAFILEPELLLLDEPFPALDPPARARLLDDLAELLAADQHTAVLVTHNLKEAARLGDRVAVIVAGKLRQVGPARQIKAHPADREVAAFLRTMPR
ncbi:MAG: ABC transporter ATP-binding protein [Chloroflexota bacterium]